MRWLSRSHPACLFLHAADSFHDVIWRPAVDTYRTRHGWLAKFDLPGVRPEDIQLLVEGRCLSLRGIRRDWLLEEGCHYHSLEITYSPFERHLEFPTDLQHARLTTDYQAGMLLVRIQTEEER